MYRAEVSGSCKWLDCIEQVQLRAYRIFLVVGRLHPKTSLQIEMGLLDPFEVRRDILNFGTKLARWVRKGW